MAASDPHTPSGTVSERDSATDLQRPLPGPTAEAASEPETDTTSEAQPTCPKCGTHEDWGMASWCPICGYYPAFGEQTGNANPEPATWEEHSEAKPLWELIPRWGYELAAGVGVLLIASIAFRVMAAGNPAFRFLGTAGLILISLVTFVVVHIQAYLFALPKNAELSPFDLFLKPFMVWRPTMIALPKTARRIQIVSWCLTAVLCALFVISGFRWQALTEDWGFKKRAQKSLMAQFVEQAQQVEGNGEGTMEDGLKELTGDAVPDDEPKTEIDDRPRTQCLVVGYSTNDDGDLTRLLLATMRFGKLKYVGFVSAKDIPTNDRIELMKKFRENGRKRPLLETPFAANWLNAKFVVEVAHEDWMQNGTMKKPEFSQVMADID